jgi:diguanylate cyclase (GGDEF)-like protein
MQYENFTILAVDDKKENLDLLLHILQNFDVIPATSGEKALQIVENEKIDLILLDIMMPNMDGFEVCKVLKNNPDTKDIPIIFATAKTDEQSIAKAYEVGGNDFVSKPLKKAEVIARVKTQLQIKTQIEKLEFLASRDSMTGIYNRRKFFELASALFEKTQNNLFISMIDIDHFKKINDTYGHDAGDIVIKTMAQLVSELLPSDAIFGRIGGEEFAILLENEKQEVLKLFEDIKNKVANLQIEANSDTIRFTISNGIAQKNNQTNSVDELLKAADEGLYEAKGTGRNKVILRQ